MLRSQITVPAFYQNYLEKAGSDNLHESLSFSLKQFRKKMKKVPRKKWKYAYAPGKWTLKQMLQHIIDTERVFVSRALWFSRNDSTPLPGFDENHWAKEAPAVDRSPKDMLDEFLALRNATVHFFASMSSDALLREGVANGNTFSVAAMGFLCAGHLMHHLEVMERLYLKETTKKNAKKVKETDD
jgi:hypothetical protein